MRTIANCFIPYMAPQPEYGMDQRRGNDNPPPIRVASQPQRRAEVIQEEPRYTLAEARRLNAAQKKPENVSIGLEDTLRENVEIKRARDEAARKEAERKKQVSKVTSGEFTRMMEEQIIKTREGWEQFEEKKTMVKRDIKQLSTDVQKCIKREKETCKGDYVMSGTVRQMLGRIKMKREMVASIEQKQNLFDKKIMQYEKLILDTTTSVIISADNDKIDLSILDVLQDKMEEQGELMEELKTGMQMFTDRLDAINDITDRDNDPDALEQELDDLWNEIETDQASTDIVQQSRVTVPVPDRHEQVVGLLRNAPSVAQNEDFIVEYDGEEEKPVAATRKKEEIQAL